MSNNTTPTPKQHGGPRSNQTGRPRKGRSTLVRVRVGTPAQMAIIDAMSPDERLARLVGNLAAPY